MPHAKLENVGMTEVPGELWWSSTALEEIDLNRDVASRILISRNTCRRHGFNTRGIGVQMAAYQLQIPELLL
jgi:hypothetical protein